MFRKRTTRSGPGPEPHYPGGPAIRNGLEAHARDPQVFAWSRAARRAQPTIIVKPEHTEAAVRAAASALRREGFSVSPTALALTAAWMGRFVGASSTDDALLEQARKRLLASLW